MKPSIKFALCLLLTNACGSGTASQWDPVATGGGGSELASAGSSDDGAGNLAADEASNFGASGVTNAASRGSRNALRRPRHGAGGAGTSGAGGAGTSGAGGAGTSGAGDTGSSAASGAGESMTGGAGGSAAGGAGESATGGAGNSTAGSAGKSATGGNGNSPTGAAGNSEAGGAGKSATGVPQPTKGKLGEWENVTSSEMDPSLFSGPDGFGAGSIVSDPGHPSDMYIGGYGAIFKSTDFGLTWHKVPSNPNPPSEALGHVLAVAGTTPATIWMAASNGAKHVYKSTDAGLTFKLTGTLAEDPTLDGGFYSLILDPYDNNHLLSGLHEMDKLVESTDGGETWHYVNGSGWPSGGKSWFPYFIDTGKADTTAKTWFAIAQDGGSAIITSDGGKNWVKPKGIENLQHPHGNAGLYQNGKSLFVAGMQSNNGDGVFRSTDLGVNWTHVSETRGGVVWGSPKTVYAMWGWACASCGFDDGGPAYQTSPQPGDTWSDGTLPSGLVWGPNSVATTTDGTHYIYVGSMWANGLWRYVEP